jgi:hypothetical protein
LAITIIIGNAHIQSRFSESEDIRSVHWILVLQ